MKLDRVAARYVVRQSTREVCSDFRRRKPAGLRDLDKQGDVLESGTAFAVVVPLPGVRKEDVRVHMDNDVLTIGAVRKPYTPEGFLQAIPAAEHSFQFQFDVRGVQQEGIKASLRDGVLTVILPKADKNLSLPKNFIPVD